MRKQKKLTAAERGRLGGLAKGRNSKRVQDADALYAIRCMAGATTDADRGDQSFLGDKKNYEEAARLYFRAFSRAFGAFEGLMEGMGMADEFYAELTARGVRI